MPKKMPKIPFNYGLFYHSMLGLFGREPDRMTRHGDDGYYRFLYEPQDDQEREKFSEHRETIARWMDIFDIIFSSSRCEYGKSAVSEIDKDVLEIIVNHPIFEEK